MTKKKTEEPVRRLVLPPSGLAQDILDLIGSQGTRPCAEEPTPAPLSAHGPPVPPSPDRLYAFADALEKGRLPEGAGPGEEAPETWVTFRLEGESFGLPVSHVQEILRVSGITRVPHAPHPVRGITNMRGRVLPVVDLRLRLGLPEAALDDQSRILVVTSRGRLMGLLVDSVRQVVRIGRSAIQPPPPDVMTEQSEYILGVVHLMEELVILLEVDRALIIQEAV